MPKGVEHLSHQNGFKAMNLCRISDAERRWARDNKFPDRYAQIGVESLMPKGVEHPRNLDGATPVNRVESLMPKGVEHVKVIPDINSLVLCRISDAERRWAQCEGFGTALQGCKCRISDAERRWALIQDLLFMRSCKVSNLWCRKALSTCYRILVSCVNYRVESLMPKGVEHAIEQNTAVGNTNVSNLWCRKALSTVNPRYSVPSAPKVSNLWCRKALSTFILLCACVYLQCVESLMPKGVEHINSYTKSKIR